MREGPIQAGLQHPYQLRPASLARSDSVGVCSRFSDVDLLVEFGPMDGYAKAFAYFDLLEELRELPGVEVDLVMAGAVKNRYIARDIDRTRQLLSAA